MLDQICFDYYIRIHSDLARRFINTQELKNRIDKFIEKCHDAGVKVTQQRIEIFKAIVQAEDHPDAEKIYQKLRRKLPTLSLDTVYRTLWVLNDLGVITTLGGSRERTRFEGNLSHHHHFVCTICGLTADFYSDEFNELKMPDSLLELGKIASTHVEVRGTCRKCSKKVFKQIQSDKSIKGRRS